MTVWAMARRATAGVNGPHPLRHEIFGAYPLLAPIDSFIFHALARAAGEKESDPAGGQDPKIPS